MQGAEESDESVITLEHEIGLLDNEVPAIPDPYNLQDDSEDYADITEVLTRSRNEWLTGVDVHNFFTFHEDPTISHVPVDLYGEGLYLYEEGEATDTVADWIPFSDGNVQRLKNSHGVHPLICLCSRLLLDPIHVGIRSTYERRVYILQENIQYAAYTFVHYRRRFIADDEEASDGGTSDEAENSGDDGNDVAGSYSDDHDNNAPGPAPTSAYAPTSASDPAKTERKMNTSSLILHVGNAYRGKKVSEICCDSLKDFNQMVHVFTEKDYLSTVGTDLSEKFDVVTGYGSPTTREERSVSLRPIPWTILKLYFAMREFPVFEESEGRRHGECSLLDLATVLEIDKNFYEANEIESLMDGLASEMQSLQLIVLSPASSSDSDSQPKLEAVNLPHSSGTSGHLTSKKGMPCQITELSTSRRPRYMTERKVILVIDENHSAKVCVSVDKPIPDGVELGDLCEKGHGFFCNATELWLKSLVSEDLDKFLDNTLLEAVYADTRTCLLYLNDAENLIGENVTAISLQTSSDNLQGKVLEGIEALCVKDLTLQSDCSKKIDGWTHSDNPRRNNDGDSDTRLCARKLEIYNNGSKCKQLALCETESTIETISELQNKTISEIS